MSLALGVVPFSLGQPCQSLEFAESTACASCYFSALLSFLTIPIPTK